MSIFTAELETDGVDQILSQSLHPIDIPAEAAPIINMFTSNIDATIGQALDPIAIPLEANPRLSTFFNRVDRTFSLSLQPIDVILQATPRQSLFFNRMDHTFGLSLQPIDIPLQATPRVSTFFNRVDHTFSLSLQPTDVTLQATPRQSTFFNRVDQRLQLSFGADPLLDLARIRSNSVHLQGKSDSIRAYVLVAGEVHFVEPNGSFDFLVAPGNHDIFIRAPGYVYVALLSVNLGQGADLVIPDITLPFGDANGDGKINGADLAHLGVNFGHSWQQITP